MKLLNYTISYLSVAFLLVIGVWALIFYFNMLDEIYDSIDDGLENSKLLIIQNVQADSSLINRTSFKESNYKIREISEAHAVSSRDVYLDSTLYTLNEKDFEPIRILKSAFRLHNGKYYELHVIASMVEEDDLIEDLLYSLLWLYLILLASILLINNVLLKRIWKPFHQILERLRNFTIDSAQDVEVPKTKVSEFKMLNESVTTLLNRTTAAFSSQKQFIENASHELQTPLAISINKLELLAEKDTTTDTQAQEISSVIHSLERATKLNKTLILLSRIENRQFSDRSMVNMNELTAGIISELSDLAEFKSVSVSMVDESLLMVDINRELASIIISNLLKNAIVHNHEGGSVTARISSRGIMVENTGLARALDASQIFKRFYKDTSLNTSTGLGLSIVKSIAELYGYGLYYQYNGMHSFTLDVPAHSVS